MTNEEKIKQTADDYATNQGGLLTEKVANSFIAGANFCREIGMKTISLRQPWAYLLCAGVKDIENRTWKLPEKYKGEMVLIHASGDKRPDVRLRHLSSMINRSQFDEINEKLDRNWPFMKVHTSAIIGSVRFVDCVINHPSIWAEKSQPADFDEYGYPAAYYNKIYNWVATDAVLFEKPILNVKGKLGFWDYDLPDEYVKLINDYDNGKKDL